MSSSLPGENKGVFSGRKKKEKQLPPRVLEREEEKGSPFFGYSGRAERTADAPSAWS